MIGIPYRLVRQDDTGPVDKVVHLATRRSGEQGEAMKTARRDYRRQQKAMGKAFQRYSLMDRRIKELDAESELIDSLATERDAQFDALSQAEEAALDAAEKLVRLSLSAGYGGEVAGQIMDQLTESDFHDMVVTIQTGEQPEDFFRSNDRPAKSTPTSPAGGSSAGSSSSTDTPPGRSTPEK